MSAKHLKLIALALAVLLLLWGGSELLSRGSDTTVGSLALPALAPADVDTVAVVHRSDTVVLAKQSATEWAVNGHRAAPNGVHDLFQALTDTAHPELVAQDTSSFGRLNVDSTGARWLSIRGGGTLRFQLLVGGPGSEFQSAYVRRPGDSHVYLWRGQLVALVNRSGDDWRDKRIVAIAPDSIGRVVVARGTERYTLERAGKRWTLRGAATDSGGVARLLEKYRAITATGFATPQAVDSLRARRPTRRLTLRDAHGRVLVALAFDSTAAGFLVRHVAGAGGEGPTVYRMPVWDVDGLTPTGRSLQSGPK